MPPSAAPAPAPAREKRAPSAPATGEALGKLRAEIAACEACPLGKSGPPLFGQGRQEPGLDLLIVSDPAPMGNNGQVFSGPDEELLTKMMAAINVDLDELFRTNICKCPVTSPPSPAYLSKCQDHLQKQIRLLQPKVIMTMGSLASQTVLGQNHQLAALRGRFHHYQGHPLVATYHPELLRQYPDLKKAAWYDLQLIQSRLEKNSG
ncbi:MAG: uracil-DNA glycosylase [Thermodesulfobacteriota bacterium]